MKRASFGLSVVLILIMICACSEKSDKGEPTRNAATQAATKLEGPPAPGVTKGLVGDSADSGGVAGSPQAAGSAAVGPQAATDTSQSPTVASVGGVPITEAQLDEAAADELRQIQMRVYQTRKRVLDEMIEERLVEKAAQEKGLSLQAYISEEVSSKVKSPTDKEIKAFYEQRKEQIRQPFDEVKGRIADHLKMAGEQGLKQKLMAKLRKNADVKVFMQPPRVEIPLDEDVIVLGDRDARILMIEFSDFQCPYSKRARETVEEVLDKYDGKIRYAFLDFPLPFHKESPKAHEAAHCAGEQGRYNEYKAVLFKNQQKLSVDDLKEYAKNLDLDTGKFNECLDSGKNASKVARLVQTGRSAGVTGTPSFFINGIMISGAQPPQAFEEIIGTELDR